MNYQRIGDRSVRMEDLLEFAAASGDWNPVHTDPVYSRRLLTGGVIAHGMSTALWMLEEHLANGGRVPRSLKASFPRALAPADVAVLVREQEEDAQQRLAVLSDRDEVTSMMLGTAGGSRIPGAPLQGHFAKERPQDCSFPQLKQACGTLAVLGVEERDRSAYPHVFEQLGPRVIAGLMAVSRLVGMHCPGLHSLIATTQLIFDPAHTSDIIEWRVTRHSVPNAPVRITFKGSGLDGYVDAFLRPAIVSQASYSSLRNQVADREFAAQKALIIGGSRGLGELTAKVIASGGGEVVLTHCEGREDAQRVADEINSAGGRCRIVRFDSESASKNIESILSAVVQPTHVYYFAAPRIARAKSRVFSSAVAASFTRIFVDAFGQIAACLSARASGDVRLFYPSTVFLDELPKEQAEYVAAKAAGEALCSYLNRHVDKLVVLSMRLPRLNTDQNAGLLNRSAPDPLPVVIDIVRAMNVLEKRRSSDE